LAGPTEKSLDDCNCADARLLLSMLNRTPLGAEYGPGAKPTRFESALREVYPFGKDADYAMNHLDPKPMMLGGVTVYVDPAPSVRLKADPAPALQAADAYRQMNLLVPAMRHYQLAIGLTSHPFWFAPECGDIYMCIGDCLALQGKWKPALAYYVKSLACGQPLADITHRMRDMDAAINENRKAPAALTEKPDAGQLEKIANLLADDDLFDQAIEAAEAARKADPTTTAGLSASLHKRKAALLQKVVDTLGEGPIMRGTKATKEAIIQEENLRH
jgi:tetratricopeptide (TPR) repeat protein